MFGDGTLINRALEKPGMKVTSTTKPFLEWVSEEMGVMGCSVILQESAQNLFQRRGGDLESLHDIYSVSIRSHHDFQEYVNWYDNKHNRSIMPNYTNLSPLITKVWYCSDGYVDWKHGKERPARIALGFSSKNKDQNTSLYKEMLGDVCVEPTITTDQLVFNKTNSHKLLQYMGSPIPGFEHKWEIDNSNRHFNLKEDSY